MYYFIILTIIAIIITFYFTRRYYLKYVPKVGPVEVDNSYPELIIDTFPAGNGENANFVTLKFRNRITLIELIYRNKVVKVFTNRDNFIYCDHAYDLEDNPISNEQFDILFKDTNLTQFKHMFDCFHYVSG